MGMYSGLKMNVELKQNTPSDVLCILKYMIDNEIEKPTIPNHPLFATERWCLMLRSFSAYFPTATKSELIYKDSTYLLNIQCNFKNYDNELEKFVDWIRPYIETKGVIGHSHYEENEEPELLTNAIRN
jgi:hypothetical protein